MNKVLVRKKSKSKNGATVSVAKGIFAASLCSLVLILASCAIALRFPDPNKLSPILGVGSMLSSSLLGGFTSAKSHRKNVLITGMVTGLIFILLISIAALLSKSAIHTTMFLCCGIAGVILSSLGGIIGVSEKKHKRRKRGF